MPIGDADFMNFVLHNIACYSGVVIFEQAVLFQHTLRKKEKSRYDEYRREAMLYQCVYPRAVIAGVKQAGNEQIAEWQAKRKITKVERRIVSGLQAEQHQENTTAAAENE